MSAISKFAKQTNTIKVLVGLDVEVIDGTAIPIEVAAKLVRACRLVICGVILAANGRERLNPATERQGELEIDSLKTIAIVHLCCKLAQMLEILDSIWVGFGALSAAELCLRRRRYREQRENCC